MKKYFYLLVLAFLPMCFTACGGDDNSSSNDPVPAVKSSKVGDIYYSDGTCSSALATGKTPIGIVVYVGSDAVSENLHGLVMALHNSGKDEWDTRNGSPKDLGLFPLALTVEDAMKDFRGLEKTKWLAEHNSAAAISAMNYNVSTPTGTTGWFIPSIGQWIAIVNNFNANLNSSLEFKNYTGGEKVLSSINNLLKKVGEEGKDYTALSSKTGSGQDGYFWSSSIAYKDSRSSYQTMDIVFHKENGVYIDPGSYMSALFTRPFLAY